MSVEKICPVCGKKFIAEHGNTAYCSESCRIEGATIARKDWEQRTGYKTIRRDRMRAYRAGKAAEKKAIQEATDRKRKEELAAEHEKRKKEQLKRLKDEAAAGDPQARMRLSNRLQAEYWEAFRDYELQYAEEAGTPSTRTVNGISVHDTHFVEEVLRTIQEQKIIISVK